MKIVIPDLISNSYFPTIAAVELGFFREEGLDMELELLFPVHLSYEALRDGGADFVGGSAHSILAAYPNWQGAKLLGALGQGMYWFLVMRSDLNAKRGDVSVVKGKKIGAAPWVAYGLQQLLKDAGIDEKRDNVTVMPVPGSLNAGVSFGVNAAKAMEDGIIDGFWANGMGAEVAVQRGVGTVVLDIRRGDGPEPAFGYTFACLATSAKMVEESPETAAAALRAMIKAQNALKRDPSLAAKAAEKHFPAFETSLISELIRRDLPYYDPTVSRQTVESMSRFGMDLGLSTKPAVYEDLVATQFSNLWKS